MFAEVVAFVLVQSPKPMAREQDLQTKVVVTLEEAASTELLRESWAYVQRVRPAPGPDGETVEAFERNLSLNLARLQEELLSGTYQPRPARRFWVPKSGGGERGVVSQTVRDRVAQGAIRRALSRKLERYLSPSSFAYREGRGATHAAHRVRDLYKSGRRWVFRGDIEDYFDRVSHEAVVRSLAPYVDRRLLKLILVSLRMPVVEGGVVSVLEVGLPQGNVLSNFLSNFYLNPFDRAMGKGLVRFADDFAVMAHTPREAGEKAGEAYEVLAKLGLRLNPDKTRILSFEQGFDFLGFRFQNATIRVSPNRKAEFKEHLEELLLGGTPVGSALRQANDLIRGWRNYFSLGEVAHDFAELDEWMEARFGTLAKKLERLVPPTKARRRPPSLGEYESPLPKKAALSGGEAVKLDPNRTPLAVRRGGEWRLTADLPDVQVPPALEAHLRAARLYHQGLVLSALGEAEALIQLTKLGPQQREEGEGLYQGALMRNVAPMDPRGPLGALRRALRVEVWSLLLQAGLDIGAPSGIPKLAILLADAYAPVAVDAFALKLVREGLGNRAFGMFLERLSHPVGLAESRQSLEAFLRQEASRVLMPGYTPSLWSSI